MKKQQLVLVGSGFLLLILLFFFGKTVPSEKTTAEQPVAAEEGAFTIQSLLSASKKELSPARQAYLSSLETAVVRGDVKAQQIRVYQQLATFWKDSVPAPPLYAWYASEASKLENSEKSLTFAARLFLDNLREVENPGIKTWMAGQGKELFERALQLNPANDSLKIGLGSCYIFGSPAGDPQQVMQGIQQILEVARRDSSNMYAQLMLGIGGVVSGQLDKAIVRLQKVVSYEPANLEAILTLAEAYERQGDKTNAVKWYNAARKLITNPEITGVIDQRIKSLQ
jgi:tetratricopeptide (TPR) repeat protein